MLDRKRDPEVERGEEKARVPAPAPPLQVGTLGWASAVGSQAVARAAASRATVAREEAEEEAPEAESEGEEASMEELPEELPE